MSITSDVRNNEAERRHELAIQGELAIAAYDRRDGALVFTHTQVPETVKGQVVASRLIAAALQKRARTRFEGHTALRIRRGLYGSSSRRTGSSRA